MKQTIHLNVNGEDYEVVVEPNKTLLDVLREELGLTGTKKGCETGECGACTILLDKRAVNSCLILAVQAEGKKIQTIEGLGDGAKLHPLQEAFIEHGATQCGYCTPGMILSAKALLDGNANPTDDDVRNALAGNLCRCTGYSKIVRAILSTASKISKDTGIEEYATVGYSAKRKDSEDKVTGRALYSADLKVPNMLYGTILRSRYPHAKILNIDTSKAEKLPGVRAVITAQEIPDVKYGTSIMDRDVLARDRVRYIGDFVAAVAATDEDTAMEALRLIDVKYDQLSAVFDPLEAMEPNAVLVHEKLDTYVCRPLPGYVTPIQPIGGTNIAYQFRLRKGDVEKGFKDADLVFEDTFRTQMVDHCYLEPSAALAEINASGIVVQTGTQMPHLNRLSLAQTVGVPVSKIRVITGYVGGGFGGKTGIEISAVACLLAKKTRRPVKVVLTREEEFTSSTVRHPTVIELKTGVNTDGTFVARKVRLIWDTGAYCDVGALVCERSYSAAGPYKIPNLEIDAYLVYTNKQVGSGMRGFGVPQMTWAVESQMDIIAQKLGMDPFEIRMKNALGEGDESATGEVMRGICLKETLQKVAERLNWGKIGVRENRGIGIACMWKSTVPSSSSGAFVKVDLGGIIRVITSAVELGQGTQTVLAQIAAEEMGVPLRDVTTMNPDTDVTPYDFATVSSRTVFNVGNSVRRAAAQAKKQLLELAAQKLETNVSELKMKDGKVYVSESSQRTVSIAELAAFSYIVRGTPILGVGSFMLADVAPLDLETGQSKKPTDFWLYGSQAAEVEVNPETGQVKLLKLVAAHDVGKTINPLTCEGQIEGALSMGAGYALSEETLIENGRVLNPTFLDYKIPTALDLPSETEPILVEVPQEDGPFGAKGLAEPAAAPTAPAIANAIYKAVGVRIKDLPITPEKILKALKEKAV